MTITAVAPQHQTETALDVIAEARRLGWRWPVRFTDGCWTDTVRWTETIEAAKTFESNEEEQGRLRNVLWCALHATRGARGRRVFFTVSCVPAYGAGVNNQTFTLMATIGPGEDLKPVVTIDLA